MLPAEQDPIPTPRLRPRWWLWIQVLALDAPIVAVVWQAALARSHRVTLDIAFPLALGLATWIIYLLDRVFDALREPARETHRHVFAKKYAIWLLWLVVPGAAGCLLWLALTGLPSGLLWSATWLAAGAGVYLLLVAVPDSPGVRLALLALFAVGIGFFVASLPLPQMLRTALSFALVWSLLIAMNGKSALSLRKWFPKETVASLIFTLGCGLGVHFWVDSDHRFLCMDFLLLWWLLSLNLSSIAAAELSGRPQQLEVESLARMQQLAGTRAVVGWALVGFCGVRMGLLGGQAGDPTYQLSIMGAALLMLGLHHFRHRMDVESHRLLVDLALVLPPVALSLTPKFGFSISH